MKVAASTKIGANSLKKLKLGQSALLSWLILTTLLVACSEEPKSSSYVAPAPVVTSSNIDSQNGPTATPPFPGLRGNTPTATATQERPVALLPTNTPPALFPSPIAPATTKLQDFTVTAGANVPDPRLTPTTFPTGQLAYLLAGNLWLIDDTGGNRRQLSNNSEIGPDSGLRWNPAREKVAYVAKSGELVVLDLQGKRTAVFAPGRTATLAAPAKLETPTAAVLTSPTPRPANRPALQVGDLSWSPDGRYLAFAYFSNESGRLASGEVWLADLITEKAVLSKAGPGFAPNWAADGRTLAFVSRAEMKQGGPPRPTPLPTPTQFDLGGPRGTPLLPPTRSGQGQALEGFLAQDATTPTVPTAATPAATPATTTSAATLPPGAPTPTLTPLLVVGPGGSKATPTPDGRPTTRPPNTPTPTPTLNIVALPSPTPTPTYPPVFVGNYMANKIMAYNPATKATRAVFESDKLPDAFTDPNGLLRSYIPAPLQAIWWSPDGRYLAFSDKKSVIGVITVATAAVVIWTGDPEQFAVYDFDWLPRSDGGFFRYGMAGNPEISRLTLATFNNSTGSGAVGDVTNQKLLKLSNLPATFASCPELAPGGDFYSYYDGRVIVIVRTDGTIFSSFTDSDCPAWSPFGRLFATIRRNSDGTVALTDIDRPLIERNLLSARAAEQVFWLRADPSSLGGQLAPTPTVRP